MTEPRITPELIAEHGITESEYEYILRIMGRQPSLVELGIFSVMWSEHASYKNSVLLLKTLPKEGEHLLAKAGEENAGVVDIGDGLAVCFKIESHNHPSAIEPFHGSATGVGGILRDIFTMGARPVAVLNSLRFGNLDDEQNRFLIREAAKGMAHYGNIFGVPSVGGEIYFEDCYKGNPLINAMAAGVVEHDKIARSTAKGIGSLVVYVGAKTGRDGIHGSTFASGDLTETSSAASHSVAIGDPIAEKQLLEATLEVIQSGLVVGIQDMGAAGLTCSSSEMAGKGEVGIEMDTALVPLKELGMSSYEIMLSESQERMLAIVQPQDFEEFQRQFTERGLEAIAIGEVIPEKLLRIKHNGELMAEIPPEYLILGGKAPVYSRETEEPEHYQQLKNYDLSTLEMPEDYNAELKTLIAHPNLASREKVYTQFDQGALGNTVLGSGSDAGVVRIQGSKKAIALATDCNGRYCYLDPYHGARAAVAESALNVACSGARPVAISNCLNFGNPFKPQVYWSFSEVIRGMSDACLGLKTPVTGGNVSFYNESPSGAIYPTPVIGMLGILDDAEKAISQYFKNSGDLILLLGDAPFELGASQYLAMRHNLVAGKVPQVDLAKQAALIELILELNEAGLINSAHDVSDGGLAIALAECLFDDKGLGVSIDLGQLQIPCESLFGEAMGRALVSISPDQLQSVEAMATKHNIAMQHIGKVNDTRDYEIKGYVKLHSCELFQAWFRGLDF